MDDDPTRRLLPYGPPLIGATAHDPVATANAILRDGFTAQGQRPVTLDAAIPWDGDGDRSCDGRAPSPHEPSLRARTTSVVGIGSVGLTPSSRS